MLEKKRKEVRLVFGFVINKSSAGNSEALCLAENVKTVDKMDKGPRLFAVSIKAFNVLTEQCA